MATMKLTEIAAAFSELVGAAEMDGWDTTENKDVLNTARDAQAALAGAVEGMAVVFNHISGMMNERHAAVCKLVGCVHGLLTGGLLADYPKAHALIADDMGAVIRTFGIETLKNEYAA